MRSPPDTSSVCYSDKWMPLPRMAIPCPGQGGRERFITWWECLFSGFHMQCSVTSFSFAPNNVGHPGNNEAAYRCENTPNKHGWKCQTIHHLLPMESRMLQRGQIVLFLFQEHNSSRLFLGRCAVTGIHLVQPEEAIPKAEDPRSSYSSLAGK